MGFKWLMTNVVDGRGRWTGCSPRQHSCWLSRNPRLDWLVTEEDTVCKWAYCILATPVISLLHCLYLNVTACCWTVDVGIWIRYAVTSLLAQIKYSRRETIAQILYSRGETRISLISPREYNICATERFSTWEQDPRQPAHYVGESLAMKPFTNQHQTL